MASPNSVTEASRIYFAYGSNLSLQQMAMRCLTSEYYGLGSIHGYKWVIGPRGYANIIPSKYDDDLVYGMLYTLQPSDEATLDRAEGVPFAYVKRMISVDLPSPSIDSVEALVYVDVERLGTGECREEYVGRMNRGTRDAVQRGVPKSYVEGALRKWVRDEETKN